ncbi:Uncharacterised protein [Bordetella pertussis]|nr:Uncharacterised protein [Bordetella pertussis]
MPSARASSAAANSWRSDMPRSEKFHSGTASARQPRRNR